MEKDGLAVENQQLMSNNTQLLMAELREDHRNISVILDVLQSVAERANAGEDPDFELVDDIMRYMTVYPDAVHHPKEDVVYAELQRRRPELAEGLDDVPEDHRQIAELGTNLRDDVEAILAGAAVRREQFVTDANAYIARLRNHMQWEEDDLFKRIDEMIEDDAIGVDVDAFAHIKDPVFELEIESGFKRLLDELG